MPNYGLVVTPTYNPMSFDDYVKPFKMYSDAYEKMADAYDQLELEAGQWEKLRDNAQDQEQWNVANKYLTDLRDAAEDLATNGLNLNTRGKVSNLRGRYSKEIKPIEEAFNYRQKMAEEQRKLNPTGDIQYTVDFSNIGLGEIMRNPSLGYSARSLSEIEKSALEQAQAFSTRNITSRHASELGNQYFQILQGMGQEAASEFLKGVQEGRNSQFTAEDLQQLNDLYNQVRDTYGLNSPSSPFSSSQNSLADERVLSGIMKGLALKDQYLTNYYAKPSGSGSGSGSGSSSESGWFIDKDRRYYYEPYGNKGYGRVLDITKPIKDSKGNVIDYEPVQDEEGLVASYNPDKDTFDTNKREVVINGKAKKAQQKETQEMYDNVHIVTFKGGTSDEPGYEFVDEEQVVPAKDYVKDYATYETDPDGIWGSNRAAKLKDRPLVASYSFKDILNENNADLDTKYQPKKGKNTYTKINIVEVEGVEGRRYALSSDADDKGVIQQEKTYETKEQAELAKVRKFIRYHFRNLPGQVRRHPENYTVEVRRSGNSYTFVFTPNSIRTAYSPTQNAVQSTPTSENENVENTVLGNIVPQ